MKDFWKMGLGLLAACVIYALLSRISISIVQAFNIFTLVVIYFALLKGEVVGALMGTCSGLLQDSLSLGVFGVAGLSKTVTGFLAGYISGKINVIPLNRNFVFLFIMAALDLILWAGLYSFIFSRQVHTGGGLLFFQPLATALIGSLAFLYLKKVFSGDGKE